MSQEAETGPSPVQDPAMRRCLSFGQQRLWFLDRLLPGSTAYNVSAAYRLRGRLNVPAVARAVGHIIDRHEILRTHYPVANGGVPYQIADDPGRFRLDQIDVSGRGNPEARAAALVDQAADAPFDLARGPVLRSQLIRLADDDHVLAFVVHHIAFDRESLQIFASEFSDAYASFRAGSAPELPALRWQYADFAAWQRTDCSPAALDRQIRYWKRRLAGAPLVLALPADHPRPAQPSPRAGAVPLAVSRVAAMSLRRLGQQHGLTMFALTMAAYHAVLARYAGNPDIVVGCGINTRARARAERMIGFFANSVAIRADASGDLPFLQLARRVGDALLDAFENQELPFEHLVERLRPERDLSRYPIIQTWFECISTGPVPDPTVPSLPDIRATPFATALVRTRFDLEAHLHTGDGTLSGRIIYADALFDRTTMLRFANHFMNFLESAAARPNDPLSRIEMIGAEERHQIINEWGTAAVTRR